MRKLNKRKLNKPRSKQAIASDLSKRAKKTLKNTKKNVKIWKKNPRRIDIEGVDTPKRKVKRTSKPKTVRSKVVKKVKPKTVKKVKPKTVKKVKPKTVKKVKPKTVKKVKPKTVKKVKPKTVKKVNSSIRQKKPKEKATMDDKLPEQYVPEWARDETIEKEKTRMAERKKKLTPSGDLLEEMSDNELKSALKERIERQSGYIRDTGKPSTATARKIDRIVAEMGRRGGKK